LVTGDDVGPFDLAKVLISNAWFPGHRIVTVTNFPFLVKICPNITGRRIPEVITPYLHMGPLYRGRRRGLLLSTANYEDDYEEE